MCLRFVLQKTVIFYCFKMALVFIKTILVKIKCLNDKDKFYLNFKPEKMRQISN